MVLCLPYFDSTILMRPHYTTKPHLCLFSPTKGEVTATAVGGVVENYVIADDSMRHYFDSTTLLLSMV